MVLRLVILSAIWSKGLILQSCYYSKLLVINLEIKLDFFCIFNGKAYLLWS